MTTCIHILNVTDIIKWNTKEGKDMIIIYNHMNIKINVPKATTRDSSCEVSKEDIESQNTVYYFIV